MCAGTQTVTRRQVMLARSVSLLSCRQERAHVACWRQGERFAVKRFL